jgi:peptidoglycan hydrolase-like protein with peptidoglycan-binding domain
MKHKPLKLVAVITGAALWMALNATVLAAAPVSSGSPMAPTKLEVPARVQVTLQALDRLHAYGYAIDTPTRADRAIRHWQKANGLTVDGIVGPQTLASLGLGGTAAGADAGGRRAPAAPKPARPTPQPAASRPAAGDVEAVIRDVWPDDLEDWALRIVSRETGRTFDPTVRNSCCWGLFQLNWSSHRGWMAGFGITDPHQLLDARTNAELAYQLYLLDGKRPWNCC